MNLVSFIKMPLSLLMLLIFIVFTGVYGCGSESSGGKSIPLSPPKSIQITGKSGELEVKWSKLADAQGVIATYEVWYGTTDNVADAQKLHDDVIPVGQLCATVITGVSNGTIYYVWVKAKYAGLGESPFTNTYSGMPIPVPAVPSSVSVKAGETLLEVSWADVDYAFSYDIAFSITSGVAPSNNDTLRNVASTEAVLSSLKNDTQYYVWVRSVNTAGLSGYSLVAHGTPMAATIAPVAPAKPEIKVSNKRLTLEWAAIEGAVEYEIYYNTSDDQNSATKATSADAAIPKVQAGITGLTNGTPYYVWVLAKNSAGSSPWSVSAIGVPEEKSIPIDFRDYNFVLGEASTEYIFAEELPLSAFSQSGKVWDRLTRVKETALGNLFTDGAAWYVREKYPTENVDFVFLNGGFVDNALDKGQISVGKVMGITDPDSREDTITFLTLKGADVIALFDMAADVVHTGRGGPGNTKFWAIVSKEVNYTIIYPDAPTNLPDQSLGSEESEKYYHGVIKAGSLKINGVAVDPERDYRIATTSLLATGAYFTILATKGTMVNSTSEFFWRGVAEYIYDKGAITPYLDGRIGIEGGVPLGSSKF